MIPSTHQNATITTWGSPTWSRIRLSTTHNFWVSKSEWPSGNKNNIPPIPYTYSNTYNYNLVLNGAWHSSTVGRRSRWIKNALMVIDKMSKFIWALLNKKRSQTRFSFFSCERSSSRSSNLWYVYLPKLATFTFSTFPI